MLHRFLPAHFNDHFGLFVRLVQSKNPAAIFTIYTSLLALFSMPLDLILQIPEKRLYKKSSHPKLPIIFVTGAPRSGTTLVAQVLIQHFPASYFNNLTAVFQRSPIISNILFNRFLNRKSIDYKSYYGKTIKFYGPNDGLYIWDRWLGNDRTRIPVSIDDLAKCNMIRFFGTFEQVFKKPFINKNNNLNTCANLIAEILENSYFICVKRNLLYLAQSLLKARSTIHGDSYVPYGLQNSAKTVNADNSLDPILDVCKQVLFHEQVIKEQQKIIGEERFWIVSYEEFCANPTDLVKKVSEKILHQPLNPEKVDVILKPFLNANYVKIENETFRKIQKTLLKLSMYHREERSNECTKTDG